MKTAVEWLVDELKNNHGIDLKLYNEYEKAKEMEKQQIIDAADWNVTEWQLHDGEQYYNETYKSEE